MVEKLVKFVDVVLQHRSYGRAAKTVCVEGSFVKFTEYIIPKENDWKLIGQTFFHTYWTDCTVNISLI